MLLKKLSRLFFALLKKINFLFLFFFIFFLTLFMISALFKIEIIEIEKESFPNDFKEILTAQLKDKNLLFLSEKEEEEKIKNNYSYVQEIVIKKKFPNRVFVKIDFYSPVAVIKNNRDFFLLSYDGRILQTTKKPFSLFPLINYYQLINGYLYKTGDWLDFIDIRKCLNIIEELNKLNLKIDTVDIKNEDMLLFTLREGHEIVFTSKKEIEKQIFSVPIILRQLKIEGKKFKRIDVRFDKPIIKF